jgi:hypothetical protein
MNVLKKTVVILILSLAVAVNACALNPVDAMTCKKVFLRVNQRTILVQRLTGKVRYLLLSDGQWKPLKGQDKRVYQMLYDAQVAAEKK